MTFTIIVAAASTMAPFKSDWLFLFFCANACTSNPQNEPFGNRRQITKYRIAPERESVNLYFSVLFFLRTPAKGNLRAKAPGKPAQIALKNAQAGRRPAAVRPKALLIRASVSPYRGTDRGRLGEWSLRTDLQSGDRGTDKRPPRGANLPAGPEESLAGAKVPGAEAGAAMAPRRSDSEATKKRKSVLQSLRPSGRG